MLNYRWVVTVNAKRMLTNAIFSFVVFIKKRFTSFLTRDHISEKRYGEITSEYHFGMESLVTVTFLLFSVLSRIRWQESFLQPSPWPRERRSVS